jgi:hypothetical protein
MSRLRALAILGVIVSILVGVNAEAAPKKKRKKAPAAAPKTEEVTAEFDKAAAIAAITEVDLSKCKTTNVATGEGHVVITFSPDGTAVNAVVDKGPWVGTPAAKCMAKAFRKVKVPAFKGEAITVGKVFHLE